MSSPLPSHQNIKQTEEQIRQRFRQQLQHRVPSLAQQLPVDSDRLSNDDGLQSFGAPMGSSDFFNSDSFRATNNSQDNRELAADPSSQRRETKVVDLQHVQPFNNGRQKYFQPIGQDEENKDNQYHFENVEPGSSERKLVTRDFNGTEQLSPLNYEEFAYQQSLIEELIQENNGLKSELQTTTSKLAKVETQLQKTKQWIRDLGNIKEDIHTLKQNAEGAEEFDKVSTENRILKCKIGELETRVNTLSRDESRVDDKFRYEKIIGAISDENKLINEKYRIIQQQMIEAEEEIIKLQSMCRTSENEVEGLTHEWKQLNDEYVLTLREFQNSQNQLEELKKQLIVQESKPVKRHQPNVVVISNDHVLNSQRTDYVSLRNRSLSGDKGTAGWNNDLTSQVERDFSHREQFEGINSILEHAQKKVERQSLIQSQEQTINSDTNQRQSLKPENTFQNNINVKNYQPIQITIASPTEQSFALAERCKKLEEYCRELIRTNKILDCENRIAIAQIINLTDPKTQLSNLTAALSFMGKVGKIYEKKSFASKDQQFGSRKNLNFIDNQQQNVNKNSSMRNLNTLRQLGAPPISQVFQNNNSQFIVSKFQGMSLSDSQKHIVDNRGLVKYQINSQASSDNLKNNKHSSLGKMSSQNLMMNTFERAVINQKTVASVPSQKMVGQEQLKINQTVVNNEIIRASQQPLNELDLYLNVLQKEVQEKKGFRLNLKKVADGYYQMDDHIISLVLGDDNGLLIRVQAEDGGEGSSVFMNFIDYLFEQGIITDDQ